MISSFMTFRSRIIKRRNLLRTIGVETAWINDAADFILFYDGSFAFKTLIGWYVYDPRSKQSYIKPDGFWTPITKEKLYELFAPLILKRELQKLIDN